MTPEEWRRIRPILESALELPSANRAAFLDTACEDSEQRKEVQSLIFFHEQAHADSLNSLAIPGFVMEEVRFTLPAGKRIGAYEILEEIAQGGMGAVYRAVRADGHYKQQVALKIVRADIGAGMTATRFRKERQILASLDHVNIAKILDGGTTVDGLPYLVMEFIDGLPITEYCDREKITVDERLQLFRTVCSAVHYAHQHLVIHRDIKPGNILVTPGGVPKLLDFGIAKILDPDSLRGNVTLTSGGLLIMTPEYASPEQLQGKTITTATDVYSLGLVLYELLAGRRPYRFRNCMPYEVARAVLETDPEKPSTAIRRMETIEETAETRAAQTPEVVSSLRGTSIERLERSLSGDLDNIVLKAIRKEPNLRYSSADQFSEDVRRRMENLPVLARKSTVPYRCQKYVLRHKVGIASAALAFLSLFTGLALVMREARIARANQARAEQRFNDVRKLANSLIFDIHDSVQNLPGATATRELILDQALQYLDSLSKESSGDTSLQRELASAYTRVATLQGIASESNLGQGDAALVGFGKALAIREIIAKSSPGNTKDQIELAAAHRLMARMLATAGKSGATEQNEQALAITSNLLKMDANNSDVLRERSIEFELVGDMQDDPGMAVEAYRKSIAITKELANINPQEIRLQSGLATVSTKMASDLAQLGSRDEALDINESALKTFESLAKNSSDAHSRRELAFTLAFHAQILLGNDDSRGSLEANRRALQIAEALAKADPPNVALELDVAAYSSGEGIALVQAGDYRAAEMKLGRAIQIYQKELLQNHADTEIPWLLGHNQIWMGEALLKQGKEALAVQSYRKSIASLETLKGSASNASIQGDLAAAHLQLARALVERRERLAAYSEYRAAMTIAEPLVAANPPSLAARYTVADAYFGMGQLARAGDLDFSAFGPSNPVTACDWYRKSSEMWRKIPNPGAISSSLKPCGNFAEVEKQLVKCTYSSATSEVPTRKHKLKTPG